MLKQKYEYLLRCQSKLVFKIPNLVLDFLTCCLAPYSNVILDTRLIA